MTRKQRRNNPFSDKSRIVRHFRLVNRLAGEEDSEGGALLSFDDMFEEYTPGRGPLAKAFRQEGVLAKASTGKATMSHPFGTEEAEEMVDLDAVLDDFAGDALVEELDEEQELADVDTEFIDIEADEEHDRVRLSARDAENIGEAARYGVLFDDRSYDYMKHLRTVGVTPGAVLINAPGAKKEKPSAKPFQVSFKADEPLEDEAVSEAEEEPVNVAPELDEAKERLVQRYRVLMRADDADPALKEALDALEDDRFVTEEFEDDLILALDRLNLEGRPKVLESFEMDHVSEEEVDIDGASEDLDDILAEYDSDSDGAFEMYAEDNFNAEVDVIGEDDSFAEELEEEDTDSEQAARVQAYLREQGRMRHSSMYERRIHRENPNLPPLPIAIAQYEELRRELGTDVDHLIVAKYAQMDEQFEREELAASEQFMEDMFRSVESRAGLKLESIRTAEPFVRKSSAAPLMPQVIVEGSKPSRTARPSRVKSRGTEEEPEDETPRLNRGTARAVDETAEEKRARKAAAKTEMREKRASRRT